MKYRAAAWLNSLARPLRNTILGIALAALALTEAASSPSEVLAWFTSSQAKTRHPIVLVHGLFGFDKMLGVDYFYRIPDALAAAGAVVHVAEVSAANTSEIRGEQLLRELKTLRAMSGNPALKFNLIGHSQGAPTVRYVAAVAPELVASVTSVGGANGGSRVADLLQRIPEGSLAYSVIVNLTQALSNLIGALSGKDPSQMPEVPLNALETLSTSGSLAFNRKFPQGLVPPGSSCSVKSGPAIVNNVRYYSWTGVKPSTNRLDMSNAPLAALGLLAYPGTENDGLVGACDSRLGVHLGDYRQNHLDEINQVFGLVDDNLWSFEKKPIQLYLEHAARLKSAGL